MERHVLHNSVRIFIKAFFKCNKVFLTMNVFDYFVCSFHSTQDGVLTCELIEEGLTDLRRTGDGTAMTYLNLSLSVMEGNFQ